ncbi:MAG: SufD family Fe-S cluster assembly protein [Vulcanimicrobiaceae bacterium]
MLSETARANALAEFRRAPGEHERPGRYWKIDLDGLEIPFEALVQGSVEISFSGELPDGVIACDLATAEREHGELLRQVFGCTEAASRKFGTLARAYLTGGAFIYIPDGVELPYLTVTHRLVGHAGVASTSVLAGNGARGTIVERIEAPAGAFVCQTSEIVTGERAEITSAAIQQLPLDARILASRGARPGRSSRIAFALADLGASLAAGSLDVTIAQPGVESRVSALFFPTSTQHVDLVTRVHHDVGDAVSRTLVKGAAAGAGQARYVGSIRIAAHAQRSDASLRDDTLLLSAHAHIDSIPALEIAANDVKAYHGATVGAIDEDERFYIETRGISRTQAERMIALGFFESVVDCFPTETLREQLREALAAKIG